MKNYWTDKEIRILKKYYSTDISKENLLKLIPNRTYDSIVAYAFKLKIKKPEIWTQEELDKLKKYYCTDISKDELHALLPDKTHSAILHKASKLGIKRGKSQLLPKERNKRFWTKDEIEFVKHFRPSMSNQELLEMLPNRTYAGLKQLNRRYEVPSKSKPPINPFKNNPAWSEREIQTLFQNYNCKSNEELMELLPGRTLSAIQIRAYLMGLKRGKYIWASKNEHKPWKDDDIEILQSNLDKTASEIHLLLPHRSITAIQKKAKLLLGVSLFKIKHFSVRWSDEEIEILKANLDKTVIEIQELLPNRTFEAIYKKSQLMFNVNLMRK